MISIERSLELAKECFFAIASNIQKTLHSQNVRYFLSFCKLQWFLFFNDFKNHVLIYRIALFPNFFIDFFRPSFYISRHLISVLFLDIRLSDVFKDLLL